MNLTVRNNLSKFPTSAKSAILTWKPSFSNTEIPKYMQPAYMNVVDQEPLESRNFVFTIRKVNEG